MFWLLALVVVVMIFGLTALIGAPYVPSHRSSLNKVFGELRPLDAGDLVVDIGSGDGAVLLEVARHGAKAYGIEINPFLVLASRLRVNKYKRLVRVRLANFWTARFPDDTTVVYTFGDSRDIKKMYLKSLAEAERLGRPIDFISYGFVVPDLTPDKVGHGYSLYHLNTLQSEVA